MDSVSECPNMLSPVGDEIKEHAYESIESPESLPYQSKHAARAL